MMAVFASGFLTKEQEDIVIKDYKKVHKCIEIKRDEYGHLIEIIFK